MNPCRRSRALLFAIIATAVSCRHRAPEPDRSSVTESIPATGCPPLPPIAGFISLREGALMTEWLPPYRATGSNVYYLQQLFTYAQQDHDAKLSNAVTEVLDDLVCLSLPVARLWAFNDGSDRSTIRNGPHAVSNTHLRAH